MKPISILMFLLCMISAGIGQITIAVIDFEGKGISPTEASALTDRLRMEIIKTGKYQVMEREMMDEILSEIGFQQTGCTTNECVVEVGRIIGVERMIGGSISRVGNIYSINARIVDIETGKIVKAVTYDQKGEISDLLIKGMREVSLMLTGEAKGEKAIDFNGTGIVYVTTDPPGAEVWLDDEKVEGVTPLIIEKAPVGEHKITVTKDDLYGEETYNLNKDDILKLNIEMQFAKGSLSIITMPFEAEVYIDGQYLGITPIKAENLDPINYEIEIRKQGYKPLIDTIKIEGNLTKNLKYNLSKLAYLDINSQPTGATVSINQEIVGETPFSTYLDSGTYRIILEKRFYHSIDTTISLEYGDERILDFTMDYSVGNVYIVTEPYGAEVYLSGNLQGTTPLLLNNLESGVHEIKIVREGYSTELRKVTIRSNETGELLVNLKRLGFLSINSTPSNAEVFINDENLGETPYSTYLDSGLYRITLSKQFCQSKDTLIVIRNSDEKYLNLSLPVEKSYYLLRLSDLRNLRNIFLSIGTASIVSYLVQGKYLRNIFPFIGAACLIPGGYYQMEEMKLKKEYTAQNFKQTDDNSLLWKGEHGSRVNCVNFSLDNSMIVSGSGDSTLKVWDADTGDLLWVGRHHDSVNSVNFNSGNTRVVSGGLDGIIAVWDADTGDLLWYGEHSSGISSVDFSPDNSMLVSGSFDGVVKVWDASTGALLWTGMHLDRVNSVSFSADNSMVVSGSRDNTVKVWNATNGVSLWEGKHSNDVSSVSFSSDNYMVVSGSRDNTVIVWDAGTGDLIWMRQHFDDVWSVDFSPDNSRVVSCSKDKTVVVWDARTGNLLWTGKHSDYVCSVDFSPDNSMVVSGSWDKTVKVWDADTGDLLWTGKHNGIVWSVNFSPDNSMVVSGGGDNTVRVWKIKKEARGVLGGKFQKILNAVAN